MANEKQGFNGLWSFSLFRSTPFFQTTKTHFETYSIFKPIFSDPLINETLFYQKLSYLQRLFLLFRLLYQNVFNIRQQVQISLRQLHGFLWVKKMLNDNLSSTNFQSSIMP